MGCKCCKRVSVGDSIKQTQPKRINSEDSCKNYKRSTHSPNNPIDDRDIHVSTEATEQDDAIIDTLLITNDHVEIEMADSQAFNSFFVEQRQQAIDNQFYRTAIDAWFVNSIQELADAIRALSRGKLIIDYHWIIFYWIACNIEYDTVSYFSRKYGVQSAEIVFRTKKGVCAGYANLYKRLCDELSIRCEMVSGYSKGYGFDDYEDAPIEIDHAWNAVEIDQHWYLVESTWGAGFVNDEKMFERKLNPYYFLSRPNEIIYHHLPKDDRWQLLREPVNMAQYLQMPQIRPTYFDLGLELVSPRHQAYVNLLPDKPYAIVLIRAPTDVHLSASLKLNDAEIDGGHKVVLDARKQCYRCYFSPTNVGKHKITIYGDRGDLDVSSPRPVLDLTLDIKQLPKNPVSFPATWTNFYDLGLQVVFPQKTHLIIVSDGVTHTEILIRAPVNVVLLGHLTKNNGEKVVGGEQVFYDVQKDLWRCNFAPNSDGVFEADIWAKKRSDIGDFTTAVRFKIKAEHIPTPPASFPKTRQLFHDLDLKVEAPFNCTHTIFLSENTPSVEIPISAPNNVLILGQLKNNDGEKIVGGEQVFYDRKKDLWRCRFAPDRNGIFEADIMAKRKSDTGNFTTAVKFKIEAKQTPIPPLSYPHTWQLFHDLDLKIESPLGSATAVWPENVSYAEIHMWAPDNVLLSCNIEYNDAKVENGGLAQFDSDNKFWQLLFAPQCMGPHTLIVSAKLIGDTVSSFNRVVMFHLNVTQVRQPIKFPTIYMQFQTNKCRIYEPLEGLLKKGSIVPIHCVIPGATHVNLMIDSNWLGTEGYQDPILKRQVNVSLKEVIIFARFGQHMNYDGLFKYAVE